jgi:hypothetical protein
MLKQQRTNGSNLKNPTRFSSYFSQTIKKLDQISFVENKEIEVKLGRNGAQ